MIVNPFKCEKCERELQPEDILVGFEDGDIVRVCGFCGNKVNVEEGKKLENEK